MNEPNEERVQHLAETMRFRARCTKESHEQFVSEINDAIDEVLSDFEVEV